MSTTVDQTNKQRAEDLARQDYHQALRKAFWGKLRRWFGHQCRDLLSGAETLGKMAKHDFKDLGQQMVPVERIVGSMGRTQDFDLDFLPRRQEVDGRWVNIARARYQGIRLPLPLLYKIGNGYFVEDGNHRVSVARAHGQEMIAARVIEISSPALIAEPSCSRLGYKIMGGGTPACPAKNGSSASSPAAS